MRNIISQCKGQNTDIFMRDIQHFCDMLTRKERSGYSITNIVRRILRIVKEECKNLHEECCEVHQAQNLNNESLMYDLLANTDYTECDNVSNKTLIKAAIIQGVNDLIDEIKTAQKNITNQVGEHIKEGDSILTIGYSSSILSFLKAGFKKCKFRVMVLENAPKYSGHILAKKLRDIGIEVSVVLDSSIAAVMGIVSKVLLGCHAIAANGGIIASSGAQLMSSCAYHRSVPVMVVSAVHKLSLYYPTTRGLDYNYDTPSPIVSYNSDIVGKVDIISPNFDYVNPSHVSLFITNFGEYPPSYLYRLLGEFYDIDRESVRS